jgi:2'-5' RNA ligase
LNKVYTSALAIIPPEEICTPIQDIRQKYDRQINRWMPHINLLYPFRPIEQFGNFEGEITAICSEIESFEILFKEFKYFSHRHQNFTMWLHPEPSDLIIELQSKLLELFPDCDDFSKHKGGFTPHLSVGQIRSRQLLNSTLKELKNQWKELAFIIKSIFFISRERSGISKFQVVKEIPLNISEI